MRPATLPRPRRFDDEHGPTMWVNEAIWGHRLHDEQTPWLAFLEFLNVLQSEREAGRSFTEPDGPNTLSYRPHRRLHLRNVLFNNPRMVAILRENPDDESRWQRWLRDMEENAHGLRDTPDFHFIRSHFASFEDFALTASLLRSTAIEGESNKRWTSKFVFPYGPAALYEDLNVRPTSITNDRRLFRASRGDCLPDALSERPWRRTQKRVLSPASDRRVTLEQTPQGVFAGSSRGTPAARQSIPALR